MRRVGFMVCAVWVCVLAWCDEAFPLERAALALSGSDCHLSHNAIIQSLERIGGVAKVEAELIPNHLIVDHDGQRLTGDQLAGVINAVIELRGGVCHAAAMRSCITAGRRDADAAHGR